MFLPLPEFELRCPFQPLYPLQKGLFSTAGWKTNVCSHGCGRVDSQVYYQKATDYLKSLISLNLSGSWVVPLQIAVPSRLWPKGSGKARPEQEMDKGVG